MSEKINCQISPSGESLVVTILNPPKIFLKERIMKDLEKMFPEWFEIMKVKFEEREPVFELFDKLKESGIVKSILPKTGDVLVADGEHFQDGHLITLRYKEYPVIDVNIDELSVCIVPEEGEKQIFVPVYWFRKKIE